MGNGNPDPWDRLEGETTKAWNAFQMYLRLGVGERSYRKVADMLGHSSTFTVERWASPQAYNWVERAAAYDQQKALGPRIEVVASQAAVEEILEREGVALSIAEAALMKQLKSIQEKPEQYSTLDLSRLVGTLKNLTDMRRRLAGLPANFRVEAVEDVVPEEQIFIAQAEHLD